MKAYIPFAILYGIRLSYIMLILPLLTVAQNNAEICMAFTNNHTSYPFTSFTKLFSGPFHPGVEMGYRFTWKSKTQHEWYQTVNAGYFYHRFLQHALTVHTQSGYRYKLKEHWRFSSALGVGYLHSVAATAVLKLNDAGEYERDKGLGRAQVMFQFAVGTQYRFNLRKRPFSIFVDYRQMIQAPFVRSYVPLLPYNSMAVGVTMSLPKKNGL